MEKILNIINKIAGEKFSKGKKDVFIGVKKELDDYDFSTDTLRVSVDYVDPKYVDDSELRELYLEYIKAKVAELGKEEVLKMIEDAWRRDYNTVDGWKSTLYKYLPDIPAINIYSLNYNPETKDLYVKYQAQESEFVPESNDGFRSEKWLTRKVIKEKKINLAENFKYAKDIVSLILRNQYSQRQFKEDFGYKFKEYSCIVETVKWSEVVEEALKNGDKDVIEFLKKKLVPGLQERIKELEKEIKEKECKINKISKFKERYLNKISEIQEKLNKAEETQEGRDGRAIIKKWRQKIKLFNKRIQAPEPDSYVIIKDSKELDKVVIINEYEVVDKEALENQLKKIKKIYKRYIKPFYLSPDDIENEVRRNQEPLEKAQKKLQKLTNFIDYLKSL